MSQKNEILWELEQGLSINQAHALLWLGCFRLAARIKDLRDEGHDIVTVMVNNDSGKRWAEYHLKLEKGVTNESAI